MTRYEKIDHLQEDMILQDGVLKSPSLFSISGHVMKVWSFLCSFINFHRNTMLFNYCNDREKEGTTVLASYVHGLTVLSISTSSGRSP